MDKLIVLATFIASAIVFYLWMSPEFSSLSSVGQMHRESGLPFWKIFKMMFDERTKNWSKANKGLLLLFIVTLFLFLLSQLLPKTYQILSVIIMFALFAMIIYGIGYTIYFSIKVSKRKTDK